MIWQLALLWACVVGLAALLLGAAIRLSDDGFPTVRDFTAEQEGLARCHRRATQTETGARCNGRSVQTSSAVSSRAGRRA